VIWRRLSYFGDTLAHAALLGVALSLLLNIHVALAIFAVAILTAIAMLGLQQRTALASDAVLGLLSHGALAAGLLALSFMTWVRMDMMGLLFGDLLAVSHTDLALLYCGDAIILFLLWWLWRPLFAATVNRDIAAAEGMRPSRADFLFMVMLAAVVAIAIKIVGVLLVTAMLIIPAAAARRPAAGPVQMISFSIGIGMAAMLGGLWTSLTWNTPSGPSVVAVAVILFMAGLLVPKKLGAYWSKP
jgi:zinc transport system permease protein